MATEKPWADKVASAQRFWGKINFSRFGKKKCHTTALKHSKNSKNTTRRVTSFVFEESKLNIPLYPKFAEKQANEGGNRTTFRSPKPTLITLASHLRQYVGLGEG